MGLTLQDAPMETWLKLARAIDRLNSAVGQLVYWLVLLMVALGAYNAVARYLDRYTGLGLSSNFYLELQWYLFSLIFLLGAAYALQRDAHVRVDVFFSRFSSRGRAWINLLGTVLFLLPFCALMLWVSWGWVANSWAVREVSPDPGGLPRYPLKAMLPIAFVLLALQGFSFLIHQIARLRQSEPETHEDGLGKL